MAQVWLVTGCSRGLGRAIAEEVLAAGHKLLATSRNIDSLSDLAQKYGDSVRLFPLDVTSREQADAAVAAAIHSFGRLDVVVNNAAAASMMPIEDVSDDDFRSQVEIVFYGTVNVTKAAIPFFRKQGYGHFIQISSISARRTIPGLGAYESAKWAQEGFSHVLALELAPFNIKVTIAEPAGLRTGMAMAHGPRSFSDDYDVTVGNEARRFLKRLGCEPIDPHKVACVLMDVAQMEDPPLRLVLGADAVDVVVHLNAKQAEEDSKWAAIGRSVDFSRDEPQASEICHAH